MKITAVLVSKYYLLLVALLFACSKNEVDKSPELSDVEIARQAGLDYLNQNKLTEAELEFNKLIELAPEEVLGYANLGIVKLRQGEFKVAEDLFRQALNIEEDNVTVRLNLFELYEQMGEMDLAKSELEKILEYDPDNLFVLYRLSDRSQVGGQASMTELNEYLDKIIQVAPKNIVPRIYLLESLMENGQYSEAQKQFEGIQSQLERLPPESQELFDKAYQSLLNNMQEQAYTELTMFHNQVKLSNWYQADVRALRGSQYSQVGIPIISFSRKMVGFGSEDASLVYKNIRFNNVAENAGLIFSKDITAGEDSNSFVVWSDIDNDGDQDLFFGISGAEGRGGLYLYRNELGRFEEVLEHSGIKNHTKSSFASLADFDNDGFLDLFLINDDELFLYKNVDELLFEDVTTKAGLDIVNQAICTLIFDADHDGDLDVFIGTDSKDKLLRNNGDGSFSDISEQSGIGKDIGQTNDAVFGDFDDDGDLDFFIANSSGNHLFSNSRMGAFEDITNISGLPSKEASLTVSAGDYNNDGFIDLFTTGPSGHKLHANQGKATFLEDGGLEKVNAIDNLRPTDHSFFDYDNDGYLDLVIAGVSTTNDSGGLILLHNDQHNGFEDASWSLPEDIQAARSLSLGDYNEDGDLDIVVSHDNGELGLMRNDGGNMNYQLKVQLVGLRQGSGKNNYYGIGSKIEIRSGAQYQMRTVSSASEYFGLGALERADILRIRWTNGVPQNIFAPNSDLDLIEQQKLKGSCPFLYAWNGEEFIFVKDFMWRSALGMPLGIMTADDSKAFAYPDASVEYLKIPGEMLKLQNGMYQLKVTGELWETIYLDELKLFAVDHPDNIDFALDEKFVLPPFPEMKLYPIRDKMPPVSVSDGTSELLHKVITEDNEYISNLKLTKYQGVTDLHDLIIDIGDEVASDGLHLFLNGWIFPSDASINVALSQSHDVNAIPPFLQVLDENDRWVTVIENLGFPLGKNKTIVTDLTGVFQTKSRKVRIRTSMQIYWDHVYFTHVKAPFESRVTSLTNSKALLHYRGFSTEFRNGGPYGPHWFDYDQYTTERKWMDLEGWYTKYGEVTQLLNESDNQYIIYNAGDEVSLMYDTKGLPDLPAGWERDFVIYSVGWVKDGDLNTAQGQTVDPLPFHGMPSYPYPDSIDYPYEANEKYLKEYNTRYVTPESHQNLLRDMNP